MAILRTYAEVLELEPNEAELDLIEKCQAGEQCIRGFDVPKEPSDTSTIRADILRYLLLGGCENCVVNERGVWLIGGYISGTLNLGFATVHGATRLQNCYFETQLLSEQTSFKLVDLSGSTLNGWLAQGAKIEGNVFLEHITASVTIHLSGTTIGGQLSCVGAKLTAKEGHALSAHSAKIEGGVFLDNITASATIDLNSAAITGQLACEGAHITTQKPYALVAVNVQITGGVFLHPRVHTEKDKIETPFHATGELRFNGATLGGVYGEDITLEATTSNTTLSLGGTTINGSVRLSGCTSTGEMMLAGSKISGRLICEKVQFQNTQGHAFNGKAMRVDRAFIWKKLSEEGTGAVSLNGAHVEELDDDPENWPEGHDLHLDGFTYTRITAKVATVPARMDWLKLGSDFGGDFRPQPYSQYAKFLRAVGHDSDARSVLEQGEALARADQRRRRMDPNETQGLNDLQWKLNTAWVWLDRTVFDPAFKRVIGYGHAPFRALQALMVLILLCFIPSFVAYHKGQFAPNSAVILESSSWNQPSIQEADNPAAAWSDKTGKGRDWESFSAGAYAVDVVIPIINFGQTDAWAPSTTRGAWGYYLWWARWVFTVLGWLVTALGAAAITGIIRRE
ncbi:MAG: hypothetical protein AAFO97_03035 [Pseudomonadota bacterium]